MQSPQQGAGGFGDSSPAAGGDGRKPGRNGTLTPVTIKQLQDATQVSPEDTTFTLDGAELAQVRTPPIIILRSSNRAERTPPNRAPVAAPSPAARETLSSREPLLPHAGGHRGCHSQR